VHSRVLREIRQRDALERIARRVLTRKILPRLAETDSRKPELVVRRMIATAAEAIGTRQQTHLVRGHVAPAPALNEAGQLARRRILWSLRVHTNRGAVDNAVAAFVA